jgi:hypothetical protein
LTYAATMENPRSAANFFKKLLPGSSMSKAGAGAKLTRTNSNWGDISREQREALFEVIERWIMDVEIVQKQFPYKGSMNQQQKVEFTLHLRCSSSPTSSSRGPQPLTSTGTDKGIAQVCIVYVLLHHINYFAIVFTTTIPRLRLPYMCYHLMLILLFAPCRSPREAWVPIGWGGRRRPGARNDKHP